MFKKKPAAGFACGSIGNVLDNSGIIASTMGVVKWLAQKILPFRQWLYRQRFC